MRSAAARLTCLGGIGVLFAVPAPAMAATGSASGLSPRLAELAKPWLRSSSHAAQAAALGLVPKGPGSLLREGNRVLTYVRFDHGAAASTDALRAAGAEIVGASRRYQTVTAAVKPVDLTRVAAVPRVAGVTEALAPVAAASTCPAGAVVSEGVEQLNAGEAPGEARDEFSVDGAGVTVGILSDSFDQATEAADGSGPVETTATDDAKSGDLPGTGNTCSGQGTPVSVLEAAKPEFGEESEDEGRAMAQIVHLMGLEMWRGLEMRMASGMKQARLAHGGICEITSGTYHYAGCGPGGAVSSDNQAAERTSSPKPVAFSSRLRLSTNRR